MKVEKKCEDHDGFCIAIELWSNADESCSNGWWCSECGALYDGVSWRLPMLRKRQDTE